MQACCKDNAGDSARLQRRGEEVPVQHHSFSEGAFQFQFGVLVSPVASEVAEFAGGGVEVAELRGRARGGEVGFHERLGP